MRKVYDFLRDLQDNNNKEWMHSHKDYYEEAKEVWVRNLEEIYGRLAKHDPQYKEIESRKTVMRINNNLMYHPDKPTYKDYFASSPHGKSASDIYIHISPNGNFVGGGVHKPSNKILKKIRDAIDYNGQKLKKILNNKSFVDFFGGLEEDEDKLKTSPQGYDQDHQYIELLRRKNFVAIKTMTQKEVISGDFIDIIEKAYLELKPLNDYMREAVEFEK